MINLRLYQSELKAKVYEAWAANFRRVLMVLPTGGGKTKLFCKIAKEMAIEAMMGLFPTCIQVHRKELVQQISLTLAEEGIVHNIIAPKSVIKGIIAAHRRVLGKSFYDCNGLISVVSVDTLNSRYNKLANWGSTIKLWITDEAAHVLKNNKWGRATEFFPNALGLGVTATPERLDKKGLGACADGVFDKMVLGPSSKWLIEEGYLSKYKIAVPQSDYQAYLAKASSGSDYSKKSMAVAAAKSHIVGDVVTNYQKFADGKQAILFASDISTGTKMEEKFNEAGISAKLLTGETPDRQRLESLLEFGEKKIQVLLNVDLFDEGLDVPGIECVIMARPTMSLSKYLQMIGRGLRPVFAAGYNLETTEDRLAAQANGGKPFCIIIDHVGNVKEHGLPCSHRRWTLERIATKGKKVNYTRICGNLECNAPYDRLLPACPWCGFEPVPSGGGGGGRISLQEVDGDLELLDPETLREVYESSILEEPGAIQERVSRQINAAAGIRAMKNQVARIGTQKDLIKVIADWAGIQKHRGLTDRMINKKFYIEHGKTISEALGEPRAGMLITMDQIKEDIGL